MMQHFEEITKYLCIMIYFGTLNNPEIGIFDIYKSSSNLLLDLDWWGTRENYLRKSLNIGILTYLGTPNDPKIKPFKSSPIE